MAREEKNWENEDGMGGGGEAEKEGGGEDVIAGKRGMRENKLGGYERDCMR